MSSIEKSTSVSKPDAWTKLEGFGLSYGPEEEVYKDTWLSLKKRPFLDRNQKEASWSWVARNRGTQAVVLFAKTKTEQKLILIRQFRMPLARWVWEMPAGLVDEGESLETAAHRELLEETGYTGEILRIFEASATSPGLSSETVHVVHMLCDDQAKQSCQEASEAIEVFLLDKKDIPQFLEDANAKQEILDSKLQVFLSAAFF